MDAVHAVLGEFHGVNVYYVELLSLVLSFRPSFPRQFTGEGYPHQAGLIAESAQKHYPNEAVFKLHSAVSLFEEGKIQESIKRFTELKDREEYGLATSIALAHAYKKCGDSEAAKEFENKTRESRRNASALNFYFASLVLFYFRRFEKAREYIERSLKGNLLFTEYVPALIEKMHLQITLRDWEQAIDTSYRCTAMSPNAIDALKCRLLHQLCQTGNHSEARKLLTDLERALEQSEPNTSDQFYHVSGYFSVLCDRDPVILQKLTQLAERAKILNTDNRKCSINSGQILLLQGRPKEATRQFQSTLDHSETSVVGLQGIIQCQLAQDSLKEAAAQLEFLSELQRAIGKSSELSYLAAVLSRKQGASSQKIIAHLDEATELHFKRLEGIREGMSYYEKLNPDFLVQLVTEYLFQAPQQPPTTSIPMAGTMATTRAGLGQRQDDATLSRCLNILEPLTTATPGCLRAAYLLAFVHYLLGDTITALNSAKALLELDASLMEGHILLAQIYLYQANLKMAEQALEAGLSNNFEVRNHPLYQLVRARLLIKQGSAKIAVQVLKQTITQQSARGSSGVSKRQTDEAGGTGLVLVGKEISTTDRLTLSLELAEAHRNLGEFHEATKVLQDAQITYSGMGVDVGRVTIATADLALSQGDHETALATLRTIRSDHACYVTARQHMADIYLVHRKEKKLYAACYRELAEKLDTPEAHLLMGDAYMTVQEPESAMKVYEGLLRRNPNDLRLASKMGQALVRTHNYAKAVSYYEAAVKAGQVALRLDLIDLLIKLKQYDKARRLLTPLVTDKHADSTAPFELTEIRKSLSMLAKLCTSDTVNTVQNIDLMTQAKAMQSRRLTRIQTSEVGDTVAEHRLLMADLCLQLASLYEKACRTFTSTDRSPTKRDSLRGSSASKEELGDGKVTANAVSNYRQLAIGLCQDAMTQAATIAGRKSLDPSRPSTIGLVRTIGGGRLSRIRQAAVRIEAQALVQLANVHLSNVDGYAACEQETLKLAQLQEEVEACERSTASLDEVSSVGVSLNPDNPSKCASTVSETFSSISVETSQTMNGVQSAGSLLAELAFRKGDFDAASKHWELVVQKHPTDYRSISRLMDAMRRAGKSQRALDILEKSRALDPRGSSATGYHFCRGLYHCNTGECALALQHLNRARADGDFAEDAVYSMVELCFNPDNQFVGSGPITDTTGGSMSATGANNANNSIPAPSSGANSSSLASTAGQVTQFDEMHRGGPVGFETAEKLLKALRSIQNPKRHQTLANMLMLMTGSKSRIEEALDTFARMTQEDPDCCNVIYGAAACYMALKQTPKARNQLKRLAKVPWTAQDAEELEKSWLLLADIYIQLGKTELSQELLKRCLQYNKSCTKAYEHIGYIMEKEQNFAEAARNYELAWTNSNKQNPTIGYKLAYNYLKIRQLIEAIEICLQVLTAYPNYPKIRKDILDKARISLRT